ncbi:MAG: transcriptional regulator, partial [Thermoplasmata archaeon]|nr:transcriptional regulator [Thermoplasmata archaeon]
MHREELTNSVREILAKSDFLLSDKLDMRGVSFDIVARRDDKILILKVLLNVDSFSPGGADDIRLIATKLGASPLLIGLCSTTGNLENGVVYSRFGVPILSLKTFSDFLLEGVPPFIFSAPGGLYVKIDGETLEKVRSRKRVSLGALAEIAGVSRRAIQMYQDGMGTTIDVALKMEEYLGEPIIIPVNPFSYSKNVERELVAFDEFKAFERIIFRKLQELGFSVLPTIKCPFDALTKDEKNIWLTGISRSDKALVKKAVMVANISELVGKDGVIFVEKSVEYNIGGTPIVQKKELKKIKDAEKIIKLIDER